MSRYFKYNFGNSDCFALQVQTVEVFGLFDGKGVVTGTVLSGTVRKGDTVSVNSGSNKRYTVTAVQVYGASVYPEVGAVVRLELSGIKKKEVAPGATLIGSLSAQPLYTDVYQYTGTDVDYFEGVFTTCFPDYQILRDTTMQGENGESIPVDLLFTREDRPCLAIFLRYSDTWRKKEVQYLKTVCRNCGMEGIVFIRNFQNKAEYLCRRVEEILG